MTDDLFTVVEYFFIFYGLGFILNALLKGLFGCRCDRR